jgi:hypothetical protein
MAYGVVTIVNYYMNDMRFGHERQI